MKPKIDLNFYNARQRNKLLAEYTDSMIAHFKRIYPDADSNELRSAVLNTMKERLVNPDCVVHRYPSPGNITKDRTNLLSVIDEIGTNKIIAPNGVIYKQAKDHLSFFTEEIEHGQKMRSIEKKSMLQAEIDGDEKKAKLKNKNQSNIKISINAISGVMLTNVFFRSVNNYNAITSLARFGIMVSYSFIELFLASNLFLRTENDAINLINRFLGICPDKESIMKLVKKYELNFPTPDKVYAHYFSNLKMYSMSPKAPTLKKLIDGMQEHELYFVYYVLNLKHLFQENAFFTNFIDACLNVNQEEIDPNVKSSLKDEDLVICIISMFPYLLKKEGKDKPISLYDAKNLPENRLLMDNYYVRLQKIIDQIQDLFNVFIFVPLLIPNTTHQNQMIRKATILSDTDSILFTTIKFVEWYTNSIKIDDTSIRLNSVIVYLVTKVCEYVFFYLSCCINADERNIHKIKMKSEFLYSVFMRTPMAKHYAGLNIRKEGNVIDPPTLDKKGKNLIGSDLCKTTLNEINNCIVHILNTASKEYSLSASKLIKRIIDFEQRIIQSIKRGETEFFIGLSVRPEKEYKDAAVSIYFNYLLYQEVFAKKYREILLPQKCKIVNIHKIKVTNLSKIDYMKDIDPEIHEKFVEFVKRYPKKEITRIPIPFGIKIPVELQELVDYRSVVFRNCSSLYMIHRGLGICNLGSNKKKLLFSDSY